MITATEAFEVSAKLCELKAAAIGNKLGRNRDLDDVTRGIMNILHDTAAQIRNISNDRVR